MAYIISDDENFTRSRKLQKKIQKLSQICTSRSAGNVTVYKTKEQMSHMTYTKTENRSSQKYHEY